MSGAYLCANVVHSALTGVGKMLQALSKAASTAADDLLLPRVLSMYPTRYLHNEHSTALTDTSSTLNTFSTASKNEKIDYEKKQNCYFIFTAYFLCSIVTDFQEIANFVWCCIFSDK